MICLRFHIFTAFLSSTAVGLMLQTAPECFGIECGELNCIAPLKIKNDPATCCPICWGPVHLDPRSVQWDNPYLRKTYTKAPVNCNGAKCFMLHCLPGYEPGYKPDNCCSSCVAAGSVHAHSMQKEPAHLTKEPEHLKIVPEQVKEVRVKGGECSAKCSTAFAHNCFPIILKKHPEKDAYQFCRDGVNGEDPKLHPHIVQNCEGEIGCSDTAEMAALKQKKKPTVDDHKYVLAFEPGTNCDNPDSTVMDEEDCQAAAKHFGHKYAGVVHYKSERPSGCYYDSDSSAVFFNAVKTSGDNLRNIDTAICYFNQMLLE